MACVSVAAVASRGVVAQPQNAAVTARVGKAVAHGHVSSGAERLRTAGTKRVRARRNVVTRASDNSPHPEGEREGMACVYGGNIATLPAPPSPPPKIPPLFFCAPRRSLAVISKKDNLEKLPPRLVGRVVDAFFSFFLLFFFFPPPSLLSSSVVQHPHTPRCFNSPSLNPDAPRCTSIILSRTHTRTRSRNNRGRKQSLHHD